MSGVRIENMRVEAFRGIADSVEFDLTSPLTLVFAANGTGKTTMCEAAEWLLTGQVERLRERGHFDQTVLRSKFSQSGEEPIVEADLNLNGAPKRFERRLVDSETRARISDGDGQFGPPIGLNDILARLAPAAAADDAHPVRAISLRQSWLRGTRFLSAEALATLIDSDDNTIERRKDIFADLLGVRHLLEAEKLTARYIKNLGDHAKWVRETLLSRDEEIERLTVELESAPLSGTNSAEVELSNAEDRLGIAPTDSENRSLASRIEALDVERHRRQHILVGRREAIEASTARWSERANLRETIARLEKTHSALGEKVAEIHQQGQAAGTAVAEKTARCDSLKANSRALEAVRLRLIALASTLSREISDWPEARNLSRGMSIAQFLNHLPHANESPEVIARITAEVVDTLSEERGRSDTDQRIELLRSQLAQARNQAPSEEELDQLRDVADRFEVEAKRAQHLLEATAGPLARLQTAGRELVGHQHRSGVTECPLCSHDWLSADALRDAVDATLAVVPEVERLAQQSSAATNEAAQLAQARLDEGQSQVELVERISNEVAGLQESINVRKAKLSRLGIEDGNSVIALEKLAQALRVSAALSELLQERDRVSTTHLGAGELIFDDTATVSNLEASIADFIQERETSVRNALRDAQSALTEQVAKRDALRRDYAVATEEIRDNRESYTRHHSELESLRQLWEVAAPGADWTEANLEAARDWTNSEQALLEDIAARTGAAQAAWIAEVRRARLDDLHREVEPLRLRLEYFGERLNTARKANSAFHESYVNISGRQIDDLSQVVNPLFARMHANRVFDRIQLGEVDDPLRWLADADNQKLNPGKDFSQGQRQDLALALFIARARSLGGTFFLDEPVAHLDDLNRVGLLDIFRATVLENSMSVNLVVTTASKPLARHLIEKFGRLGPVETPRGPTAPLRVIELDGNGRTGVRLQTVY